MDIDMNRFGVEGGSTGEGPEAEGLDEGGRVDGGAWDLGNDAGGHKDLRGFSKRVYPPEGWL